MKKKIKKLSSDDKCDLANKCESEGGILGGYVDYGMDWDAIERLGLDLEKIRNAILVLQELEWAINGD